MRVKRINKKRISLYIQIFIICLGCFVIIIPLIWTLLSSFKANHEILTIPIRWIPEKLHFENYIVPFTDMHFLRYFLNSVFVSVTITVSNLFLCSLAGFGLAKYPFPGNKAVFIAIISVLMLPIEIRIISQYLIVRAFGWTDNYLGLIIPLLVIQLGIFVMRQHLVSVPNDYLEAARLDGCSEFGIYIRVILPLSKSSLAAVTIFVFLVAWNDYFWPLIIVNTDRYRTLPLGLALFAADYGTSYNHIMAMSVLVALPILVVFFSMQKRFISGMVMTGIKG